MAGMKVKRAFKHQTPGSTDKFYQPGDKVLVWKEKVVDSRIGEWLCSFEVLAVDEGKKLMYVRDVEISAALPV